MPNLSTRWGDWCGLRWIIYNLTFRMLIGIVLSSSVRGCHWHFCLKWGLSIKDCHILSSPWVLIYSIMFAALCHLKCRNRGYYPWKS
jgi:hypothetical protein